MSITTMDAEALNSCPSVTIVRVINMLLNILKIRKFLTTMLLEGEVSPT
jgi:hypothetical protein